MGDSNMIALIAETMKNHESVLIAKLEMAGRFSAMCASKTRMDESETDKSVNDVCFQGIALGIMEYNSIVNDLIFLRIIKEFMSEFKIDKTHNSSKTRKYGNEIKSIKGFTKRGTIRVTKRVTKRGKNKSSKKRSHTRIGGTMLIPVMSSIPSAAPIAATAAAAAESGHGRFGIHTSRSRSLDRQSTGTRRNRSRSPARRSMISNAIPTETHNKWGISKKYLSILFAIVFFFMVIAFACFRSTRGISEEPSHKPPHILSPNKLAVLNIHFKGEAIERAGQWVSGNANCGVFSFKDRPQQELERSVNTYQGMNIEDTCIGKSSLRAQSDAFSSGFMTYANSLIMKQKDICNVIFKSGFSYHNIVKSKIWNGDIPINNPSIGETYIGTQWQDDIIMKLCDVGSFKIEPINGQDTLTITILSPENKNHYLKVFTQQLNELESTDHITTGDKDELLKVLTVLREFPDLSDMTHKSIVSRVISNDLPLGDKFNGISQIIIDYNSNVKRWRETHDAMLDNTGLKKGYHLEQAYLEDTLKIERNMKTSDQQFIWFKANIERYLNPFKAIIPAFTDSIVTVFTSVVGGGLDGIGDLTKYFFNMINTITSMGIIPATFFGVVVMIFKDTISRKGVQFLNAVLERLSIEDIRQFIYSSARAVKALAARAATAVADRTVRRLRRDPN